MVPFGKVCVLRDQTSQHVPSTESLVSLAVSGGGSARSLVTLGCAAVRSSPKSGSPGGAQEQGWAVSQALISKGSKTNKTSLRICHIPPVRVCLSLTM